MTSQLSFFDTLQAELVAESQVTGEAVQHLFLNYVLSNFSDAGVTQDMTLAHLETAGLRNRTIRLDAYAFDDLDNSFHAIVCDYQNIPVTLTRADLDKLFNSLEAFVSTSISLDQIANIPETSEAVQAAHMLLKSFRVLSNIKFYIVTNGLLSSRIRDLPPKKIGEVRVDYQVWDIARIQELTEAQMGRSDLFVSLTENGQKPIPALKAKTDSNEFSTYLFVMSGNQLAEIFDQYGSRLLEGNVRSFLTAKGKVNSGIRETVLQQPERFLAYNNGLTATASAIEADDGNAPVVELTGIKDLQIVNGGQTTATLWNVLRTGGDKRNQLNQVEVQVKLIVIPDELDSNLIPRVAQFANSQNKVQDSDLASNSNYNRKLGELSKLVFAPPQAGSQVQTHWYFERARGAYANERNKLRPGEAQNKFDRQNPKSQLFTKVQVAKYVSSWNLKPQMASKGDQKNFDFFTREVASKFNSQESLARLNEDYFKKIVCLKIIFDTLRANIPKSGWYSVGGYLANCVTYGMSKFNHELASRNLHVDWAVIWRNQALSKQMVELLLDCGESASRVLFDESRPQQNISEWAKQDACWSKVQGSRMDREFVAPEITATAQVDRTQDRTEVRASASALREVRFVTYVSRLHFDDWGNILGDKDISLSPMERELATQLQRSAQSPLNARQQDTVVKLLKRAWAAGVKIPEPEL